MRRTSLLLVSFLLGVTPRALAQEATTASRAALTSIEPALGTNDLLLGIRTGWARYRLAAADPNDRTLLIETGQRAVDLGAKAMEMWLSPNPGKTLVQTAQAYPFQQSFAIAHAHGVKLIVLQALAADIALPYWGTDRSAEVDLLSQEYAQLRDLTAYLRGLASLDGITVVLKNWETDNIFCAPFANIEVGYPNATPCSYTAGSAALTGLLNRSVHLIRWLKNRRDAVAAGRAASSPYNVVVWDAVDVNLPTQALGTHETPPIPLLRVTHLLPYIGPDVITYSAWDSIDHPSTCPDPPTCTNVYFTVNQILYDTLTFLNSQLTQKASASNLCTASMGCLASVGIGTDPALLEQPVDPMGLGVKRLIISEFATNENDPNLAPTLDPRYRGFLDAARSFGTAGIRAAFFWAMYDKDLVWYTSCSQPRFGHECSAGVTLCDANLQNSSNPIVGCNDQNLWELGYNYTLGTGGYYIYRTDGTASNSLQVLQNYALNNSSWVPEPPPPPVKPGLSRDPFYDSAIGDNALIWDIPNDSRIMTYRVIWSGPSNGNITTRHHWYTLPNFPPGRYTWTVRTEVAGPPPANVLTSTDVQGPSFKWQSAQKFYTLPPCRVVDSRPGNPLGPPTLAPSETRTYNFAGRCGIPTTAAAIAINVTIVYPSAAGSLMLYPSDAAIVPVPATYAIAFRAGQVRANNGSYAISTDGVGGLRVVNSSAGNIDVVIDVSGYYR